MRFKSISVALCGRANNLKRVWPDGISGDARGKTGDSTEEAECTMIPGSSELEREVVEDSRLLVEAKEIESRMFGELDRGEEGTVEVAWGVRRWGKLFSTEEMNDDQFK